MKMKLLAIATLSILLFIACEKKETPVAPATSQALTAGMGSDYSTMLYFNVLSGLFVKQLPHYNYDLQLEAAPNGRAIYLNSSNFMFVRNKGQVPFESITDTLSSAAWRYDYPTGSEARTAIGTWYNPDGTSKNEVYVLNRGYDANGNTIGFAKLMVLAATDKSYTLRYGTLDNTFDTTITIQKNEDKYLMQFSLTSFGIEDIDPDKNEWHLQFSQYTDYDITDQGDTIPYLVRGVLSNNWNTQALKVEGEEWTAIDKTFAEAQLLSSARNSIGYDWKAFSLTTGIYEIVPGVIYIIREAGGNYYKLRFVDFYNDSGEVGYAKFEIIGL
jgi:hypothetical protein